MRTLFLSVPILLLTVTASAQDADRAVDPFTGVEMTASDGGRAVQGGTEPPADDADPLNQMVRSETTGGPLVPPQPGRHPVHREVKGAGRPHRGSEMQRPRDARRLMRVRRY